MGTQLDAKAYLANKTRIGIVFSALW